MFTGFNKIRHMIRKNILQYNEMEHVLTIQSFRYAVLSVETASDISASRYKQSRSAGLPAFPLHFGTSLHSHDRLAYVPFNVMSNRLQIL